MYERRTSVRQRLVRRRERRRQEHSHGRQAVLAVTVVGQGRCAVAEVAGYARTGRTGDAERAITSISIRMAGIRLASSSSRARWYPISSVGWRVIRLMAPDEWRPLRPWHTSDRM
jgi:hypothetical protein